MKILYIANERSAARLAERVLPDFKVLWASNFERVGFWILEYPDVAALIAEVQSDSAGCSYLKRARGLGLKAPVVVVLPDGAGSPVESLKAGVDSYIAKNQSFSRELPVVVARAIDRAQTSAAVRRDHLSSGTVRESAAGLPTDRQSHGSEIEARQPLNAPALVHRSSQSTVEVDDGPVSAIASKSMLERRISELESMFHQREQSWMAEQAAAVERQGTLEKFLHQERSMRTGIEQKLADAKAALEDSEHRHSAAITAASEALAERHTQYEVGMTRVASTWDMVDEQLRQWALQVEQARQSLASSAVTEVERLRRHEAELTSQLAEATAARGSLEGRLADAESALRTANERASHGRVAAEQAVERQADLEGLIRQERATRADVEQQLAQAEAARREAERHSSAVTTALTERQAQLEVELSQTVAARDDFKRQVHAAETALLAARHDHTAATTEVERLARHQAELTSQLAEATATSRSLEGRLAEAENALRTADERASHDRRAAAEQAAERQVEFQAQLEREVEKRRSLEDDLASARIARDGAEKQHQSAVTAAAALRTEFGAEWARAAKARSDLEVALNEARQTLASTAATVERLIEREADLERLVQQERATRADVEQQLAQVQAARREAERQHASAMTTALASQAQFEVELSQTAAARDDLKRQVHVAETALAAARHDHAAAATEVERLARHEAELTSQLAEAAATRRSLEDDLAGARIARDAAEKQHQSAVTVAAALRTEFDAERAGAAEARGGLEAALNEARQTLKSNVATVDRLTEREAELEGLIRQERAARADVEQQLAQVEAARREDERQHASVMTTALAEFEVVLSQTVAVRDDLKRQLSAAETALSAARHDHAAAATEVERLTRREAELTSHLEEATVTRRGLERQLVDAATAMKEADERAARDQVAAAQKAAEREVELEGLIGQERGARADVEQQLAQVEAARRQAERQHASAMTTAATTLAERQAQFEVELSQTAAARDDFKRQVHAAETALRAARHDHATAATEVERLARHETELTSQLAEAAAMRRSLEGQLAEAATAMKEATKHQADVESRLAQEITNREALERGIAEVRSAAADAEQRFRDETATLTARASAEVARIEDQIAHEREDHKDRLARVTAAVAEGDARLKEQAAHHASSLQAAELERSQLENDFQTTLIARQGEIERLQGSLNMTIQELTGARRRCDILQTEADRATQLERQLDESRVEIRRQFHQCALALWRCTADGALTHANRVLWDLVGCRKPDELHGADFAKTVFESPNDLTWLIERCSSTKARHSVETAWKRQDGKRFVVRLSAVESAPDVIEIAVEDITSLRVLESKLDQAHRMEAVGRVASEVAVTCGKLLRDAYDDGQQFLSGVTGDPALRKRGEMLLDEVARAAGYLQRLDAYGDEQANALDPVDLNKVLGDLKPVLKHVAGDDVELAVSQISSPLNVDMKADHVERLFVNLAGYGRERMPFGGQLRIELATVVVDQEFIAHYPNVRQGPHALITVTEARRARLAEGPLQLRDGPTESTRDGVASEKPGVDLGALQELIQECGGHLWMTVEPPGNMVVEIRLPLRVWDDPTHQTTSDTPSSRRGVMARWFRH